VGRREREAGSRAMKGAKGNTEKEGYGGRATTTTTDTAERKHGKYHGAHSPIAFHGTPTNPPKNKKQTNINTTATNGPPHPTMSNAAIHSTPGHRTTPGQLHHHHPSSSCPPSPDAGSITSFHVTIGRDVVAVDDASLCVRRVGGIDDVTSCAVMCRDTCGHVSLIRFQTP